MKKVCIVLVSLHNISQLKCNIKYTACPTRYRTGHLFNNFTTNEDIATKFEADLPHCVRYVTTSYHVQEVATICVQTGLNPGAPYFRKSLPVRPLSLPEFFSVMFTFKASMVRGLFW